jgi:hypothetical protein
LRCRLAESVAPVFARKKWLIAQMYRFHCIGFVRCQWRTITAIRAARARYLHDIRTMHGSGDPWMGWSVRWDFCRS